MQNNEREILDLHTLVDRTENIQMNVVGVVVLAYPPRNPIQAPQWAVPPSIAHVQRNDVSSSVQQGAVEW
jgi:hypothetical protein